MPTLENTPLSVRLEQSRSDIVEGIRNPNIIRGTIQKLALAPYSRFVNRILFEKTIAYINDYGSSEALSEEDTVTVSDIIKGTVDVILTDFDDAETSHEMLDYLHPDDARCSYIPDEAFTYCLPMVAPTLSYAKQIFSFTGNAKELVTFRELNYYAFLNTVTENPAFRRSCFSYFSLQMLVPKNRRVFMKKAEMLKVGDVLNVIITALDKPWIPSEDFGGMRASADKYITEKRRAYKLFYTAIFAPLYYSFRKLPEIQDDSINNFTERMNKSCQI